MTTLGEEVDLLRKIPLFTGIETGKLKLLAFASDRKIYEDGQVVFNQGEIGDAAYVVIDGIADILVETGGKTVSVANIGANEIIGEISILCDVPRTATVKAKGKMVTLKIKKEHFIGLIMDAPKLGIEVMRELALRLSKTTAELTEAKAQLKKSKAGNDTIEAGSL